MMSGGLVDKYKSEPIMLRYILKSIACLSNEGFKRVPTAIGTSNFVLFAIPNQSSMLCMYFSWFMKLPSLLWRIRKPRKLFIFPSCSFRTYFSLNLQILSTTKDQLKEKLYHQHRLEQASGDFQLSFKIMWDKLVLV